VIPSGTIGDAIDGGNGAAVSDDPTSAHLEETYKHYFGTMRRELAKKSGGAASSGGSSQTQGAPGGAAPAPTPGQAPTPASPK